MPDPAVIEAQIAELNSTLERARDERLRLARLLKDGEARSGGGGAAAAGEVRQVLAKVSSVDAALTARFERLKETEALLDGRFEQIERLEAGVRELSAQFTQNVREARDLDGEVAEARGRIEREAKQVLDTFRGQFRGEFDAICAEVAQTVEQMQSVEQLLVDKQYEAQRVAQQAAGMIERQVEAAAADFEQQARSLMEPKLRQAASVLEADAEAARQSLRDKLAVIDADANHLIEPLQTMAQDVLKQARAEADGLVESLAGRLDSELADRLDQHRDAFAQREAQLCRELEARFGEYSARLREQMDREHHRQVDEAAERVGAALQARMAELVKGSEARADELARSMQERLDACFDQVSCEADNAADRLRRMLGEVQACGDREAAALLEKTQQRVRVALDGHVLAANEEIATAASAMERRAGEIVAQFERETQGIVAPLSQRLEAQLASLREEGPAAVDDAMAAARERLQTVRESAGAMVTMVENQLARRLESIGPTTQARVAAAERELDEQVDRIKAQIDERLAPLRAQTLDEIDRLAECSVQVRQLAGSLRAPFAAAQFDTSTIVDPERMLDALDKLARRLGYRVLPAADLTLSEADAQAA